MKENMNIFEYATRRKVRFPYKGLISVEDLWDLPLTELDKVFKALNATLKKETEESLLVDLGEPADAPLQTSIAIVKHIFSVKLAEQEARDKAAAKKEQKQKIMAIIAQKQDSALYDSSIEDLQKMLDQLGE